MRDIIDKASLLEKKIKDLLKQGEEQASLLLTNEITEILSITLSSFQIEKQKETEKGIHSFVNERVESIKNNKTPIELKPDAKIVVHLIPLVAFEQKEDSIDISFFKDKSYLLPQLTRGGHDYKFNYDGYLTFSHSS